MEAVPLKATTTWRWPQLIRQRVSCFTSQKLSLSVNPYSPMAVSSVRIVRAPSAAGFTRSGSVTVSTLGFFRLHLPCTRKNVPVRYGGSKYGDFALDTVPAAGRVQTCLHGQVVLKHCQHCSCCTSCYLPMRWA